MDDYYTDDITWCSNRRCNKKCERNPKRIIWTPCKEYSFADLENTVYCVKTERKSKSKSKKGE